MFLERIFPGLIQMQVMFLGRPFCHGTYLPYKTFVKLWFLSLICKYINLIFIWMCFIFVVRFPNDEISYTKFYKNISLEEENLKDIATKCLHSKNTHFALIFFCPWMLNKYKHEICHLQITYEKIKHLKHDL